MLLGILRGTFITSLFFLTVALTPFVGAMLLIFIPLPVCFYLAALGRAGGLAVLVLSLLVLTAAQHAVASQLSMTAFIILGGLGVIMSEILKKNLTPGWTVGLAALIGVLLMGVMIVVGSAIHGRAPGEHIYHYMQVMVTENIKMYGELDLPAEQLQFLKDNSARISRILAFTFPALSLIGVAVIALIDILAARLLFRLRALPFPDFGKLTCWRAPDHLVWLFILSGACLLVPQEAIRLSALNILAICLFVYFLQGLAIGEFFFHKRKTPFFLRLLFYFLLMIQQYLMLLIAAVGLFDLWIDFRKLTAPTPKPDQGPKL
ncbi:MAG: DUF2232 domain-containing protein [Pseudomonadota bacterium]|nr:DUF2232 domain-containing protein [Pseudomonadota bacterium]